MAQPAIDELLRRCGSLYQLVILAARRAKEVAEGSPRLIRGETQKVTSVALEEIMQGKVLYKPEEPEAGSGKRGRGGKGKEEKKRAS